MAELESIAARVAARLIERGGTIAVAESSAGGLVAAALLAVPGASSYFLGGAVVYTATARQALLAITPEMMTGMRPASEPYALLLARVSRERFGATWGLAETGAAGPTGNRYGDAAGMPASPSAALERGLIRSKPGRPIEPPTWLLSRSRRSGCWRARSTPPAASSLPLDKPGRKS